MEIQGQHPRSKGHHPSQTPVWQDEDQAAGEPSPPVHHSSCLCLWESVLMQNENYGSAEEDAGWQIVIQQQCDHQPKSPFQSWRWLVANAKGGKTLTVFVFCLTLAWHHPLQKNNTQSPNDTSSVIPSHIIEYYKILKLIHAEILWSQELFA